MTAKSIFLRATEAGLAEAGSWELQRRLEAITSENSRIGNLGPALFVVICLLAAVILLCFFSGFIDKPGPRRAMQAGAVALIVIPALFFSMTSYVTDTSQILDKDVGFNIDIEKHEKFFGVVLENKKIHRAIHMPNSLSNKKYILGWPASKLVA